MRKVEKLSQKPMPVFSSEAEEAAWWDAHPEVLTQLFRQAKAEGRIRHLSETTLPGARDSVTIRIPANEITRAVKLAEKHGLSYKSYVKKLLHEALDAEEKRLAG